MEKLTTQTYWESYYSKSLVNKSGIESVVSEYEEYWDFLIEINNEEPPKTILEIGGYPGRYLAFLAKKYNLVPTSIDFNSDRSKIDDVMQTFEIKDYTIIHADIFTHQPTEKYDLVLSNGFIEHFDNFDVVLDKHCQYLKEGGTMLIMIPNMRYYIKYYKWLVDKKNLKIHNLKTMDFNVFKNFATRNELTLQKLTYFGGFPYTYHDGVNFFQKIIYKIHRYIFKFYGNKILKKNPSKYFSSTIIAVFKK